MSGFLEQFYYGNIEPQARGISANKTMAKQDAQDRKKRKTCSFCADHVESIDYKDAAKLKRYLTEAGKIIPRRVTGNCAKHQRMVTTAIKRAREAAIISYVFD